LGILSFLILFPLIACIVSFAVKKETVRNWLVRIFVVLIAGASIVLACMYFDGSQHFLLPHGGILNYIMIAVEAAVCGIVIYYSLKHKRIAPLILSVIQTAAILIYELTSSGSHGVQGNFYIDKLTIVMVLIIGVIGGLICLFTPSYMKDYHHHHTEYKNNTNHFIGLLFLFLFAMFGLVCSNNLVWISAFWEITTLCSFIFIKYTGEETAVHNAFTALNLNLIGGAGFTMAIILLGRFYDIHTLTDLMSAQGGVLLQLALFGLAVAGTSKAAQLPFSKWLLGAMVAPTPSSALLHSSTMVKAGVYLLIRIAASISGTLVGLLVILVGGITFLIASLLAITQTDAKKTLAYSTISNLGLIVACSGVGTYESLWAAIFLMIFHAVSKSMLFLCVGTIEHRIGTRDIEDMHGLAVKYPTLAFFMTIGIVGMFLAPFGMLISKWAALRAFTDSYQILVVVLLALGSAATMFYWTKWLGKLYSWRPTIGRRKYKMPADLSVTLWVETILSMALCLGFTAVSAYLLDPLLTGVYHMQSIEVIQNSDHIIMIIMMLMLIIMPFTTKFLSSKRNKKASVYMSGVNEGDDTHFVDAFGNEKNLYLTNWYMTEVIDEKKVLSVSIPLMAILYVVCFVFLLGVGGVL
jgi:ech hydrogenase subunit A